MESEFSDSCAYRTCHYRHNAVSDSLKLAAQMAGELEGTEVKDPYKAYRNVTMFADLLSEMVSDVEGDAHLYGALREVGELAARLLRKEEEKSGLR